MLTIDEIKDLCTESKTIDKVIYDRANQLWIIVCSENEIICDPEDLEHNLKNNLL